MATVFTFDVTAFREAFPAFSNDTTFPDDTLQGYWDVAIVFMSDVNYGYLRDGSRLRALNLLTAHLAALSVIINAGGTPGLVQASTIDKVSVTLTPPPVKDQLMWWLNLTPYGQQLAALLNTWAAGGLFAYGSRGYRGLN